jgi:hypothetical protein
MATDIKLDQQGRDWLIVEGRVLKTTATDLMIDSPGRRRGGSNPFRRALVHDFRSAPFLAAPSRRKTYPLPTSLRVHLPRWMQH